MNGTIFSLRNKFIIRAALLFILSTIAFYILTEHRAHLLAYSSYIFFLAYILLHFFSCVESMEIIENMEDIAGMATESTGIKKRIKGLNMVLEDIRTESSMIKPERSNELHPGFLSLALIIVNF
ncbi:DUF2933 domain-containing protein [Methanosarcina horonobensis]|uniref:DUF2933 domain-containing protein n=1 Tax=Methanosarcina horonobensis TaxID=418008 RepID=UPI000AF93BAA|nr:DUF2933 domain-containing protein [Methanosarcina horonobensis]